MVIAPEDVSSVNKIIWSGKSQIIALALKGSQTKSRWELKEEEVAPKKKKKMRKTARQIFITMDCQR